jgi:hypothetical protein
MYKALGSILRPPALERKKEKKRRQEREVLNIKLWFRVCSRKNGRRQNINSYKNFFCKLPEKQGCD